MVVRVSDVKHRFIYGETEQADKMVFHESV